MQALYPLFAAASTSGGDRSIEALIPLAGSVLNFLLALFVLSRSYRATAIRVYSLLGICIAVWNLGTYFLFVETNEGHALFWARFLQFGVIFIPVLLFHLSLLIAQIPVGKYIYFLYTCHVVLALSNLSDVLFHFKDGKGFFITGVTKLTYAYYSQAGYGFWAYSALFVQLHASVFILFKKRRTLTPLHRKRLTGLIVAAGSLAVFGFNDILPIIKIYHYPLVGREVYPFGSMAAIFYGLIVGYSVLQHQLLDIRVTLGKIAANLVRLLFVFLISLFLLLIAAKVTGVFNLPSLAVALIVFLISMISASIYFPRLFGRGDDLLERKLLGDRFEYHDKVQGFIQSIHAYTDATLLIDDLHDLLVSTVKVRSYSIILLNESTRQFSFFRAYPEQQTTELGNVHADSPVFQYFQKKKADFLGFNAAYSIPGETEIERAARKQLNQFDPEFCFPLLFDEELFGLVLIGPKVSDELYTAHDLRLLTELVRNLSLVLNQIRLKKRILVAEELELIGRMSRGMAHDLNNLLTPVSTLLQLLRDGLLDSGKRDELLPVTLRNVTTMQSYIREALFFSQNHTPRLEPGRLDLVIQKAVATAEPAWRRKEVEVSVNTPENIVVEMDSILIQRLIANILSNAIDASPVKSTIRIELQRLARTESNRDWLRVRIIDEGEGIKRENLKRVFTPYFTTKDRGDETRGFGLGLAICRQIVHLHGGNLNIASEEKKGTTVQVDLPSRPAIRPAAAAVALNRS
ncbi:MAG TPA: ATP-binding protein [Candidatus Angelobacter sp.]|nr:ATP-binding protein [Candidatus Angelobacter sp.]